MLWWNASYAQRTHASKNPNISIRRPGHSQQRRSQPKQSINVLKTTVATRLWDKWFACIERKKKDILCNIFCSLFISTVLVCSARCEPLLERGKIRTSRQFVASWWGKRRLSTVTIFFVGKVAAFIFKWPIERNFNVNIYSFFARCSFLIPKNGVTLIKYWLCTESYWPWYREVWIPSWEAIKKGGSLNTYSQNVMIFSYKMLKLLILWTKPVLPNFWQNAHFLTFLPEIYLYFDQKHINLVN